jgi:hypothetical protein
MDIVTFATKKLKLHLFDWEKEKLSRYNEVLDDTHTLNQWVRPNNVDNQFLLNIYIQYKEFLASSK